MIKTFLAIAAFAAATMLIPVTPAAASPDGCNCTWMAIDYDVEKKEFIYGWVCPTNPICQDQVSPD